MLQILAVILGSIAYKAWSSGSAAPLLRGGSIIAMAGGPNQDKFRNQSYQVLRSNKPIICHAKGVGSVVFGWIQASGIILNRVKVVIPEID